MIKKLIIIFFLVKKLIYDKEYRKLYFVMIVFLIFIFVLFLFVFVVDVRLMCLVVLKGFFFIFRFGCFFLLKLMIVNSL